MARTSHRYFVARNSVAVGLISVAASIALVGVVWASSTATGGNNDSVQSVPTDSSTPGDETNPSPDDSVPTADVTDVNERLDTLTARIDDASQQLDALSAELSLLNDSSQSTQTQVSKLSSEIDALKIDITNAVEDIRKTRKTVDGLDEKVSALTTLVERKTSLINDEGKYTGSIGPSQITPQLKVSDILGKWPLDRTEGDLDVSKLYSDLFSCTSDFRNHAVISVDAFRRMTCLRIPK